MPLVSQFTNHSINKNINKHIMQTTNCVLIIFRAFFLINQIIMSALCPPDYCREIFQRLTKKKSKLKKKTKK